MSQLENIFGRIFGSVQRSAKACTWLRDISSCSCLTFLPGPAWLLLNKICKPLFRALYFAARLIVNGIILTMMQSFNLFSQVAGKGRKSLNGRSPAPTCNLYNCNLVKARNLYEITRIKVKTTVHKLQFSKQELGSTVLDIANLHELEGN